MSLFSLCVRYLKFEVFKKVLGKFFISGFCMHRMCPHLEERARAHTHTHAHTHGRNRSVPEDHRDGGDE